MFTHDGKEGMGRGGVTAVVMATDNFFSPSVYFIGTKKKISLQQQKKNEMIKCKTTVCECRHDSPGEKQNRKFEKTYRDLMKRFLVL